MNFLSKFSATVLAVFSAVAFAPAVEAQPKKGWTYVGSVTLEMHAQGAAAEGEYFVRVLPMSFDGTPRFMMQSLSIEGPSHNGKYIVDCAKWKYKEYDLRDQNGKLLPTGWNDGHKNSGYIADKTLRLVCR